jgi:SAM-dependent methyltransferase
LSKKIKLSTVIFTVEQMINRRKYIHEEHTHNLTAPQEIVPLLISYFNPHSVADVGCGIGTFLRIFLELGVHDVVGIEGPWVNKELLFNNIDEKSFIEADLEKEFSINRKFDIALSLEVGEHLHYSSAETYIKNLISLSDTIIFSAALPGQGGQNHINEQWMDYWQKIFEKHNYYCYDVFRQQLWNNPGVNWWYSQNMFLFTSKNDLQQIFHDKKVPLNSYIHPELFKLKAQGLSDIVEGKKSIIFYIKLILKWGLVRFKKK